MPRAGSIPAPRYQKTVLPHGLRVVTEYIPSVRSIAVGAWVESGSRDEAEHLSGVSHFIEHMVFKGTKRRRMHHIAQRMEAVGGYLNAFTGKEYTCYYARGLDEHLPRALDVLLDLIFNPTFPAKELDKEKDVVLEEMKMYADAPEDHIYDRFESVIYAGHALARPVLGYPETVKSFTRDQVVTHMDQHYAPRRMVVTVAGNVDHARVVRLVEKTLLAQTRTGQANTRTGLSQYQAQDLTETHPLHQAHMIIGRRGYSVEDQTRTAFALLNTILGGGMSSRLNQNIREKYGFCYNVYSFANALSDTGDFGIYIGLDPSKVTRSKQLIYRELDRLMQKPVSAQMLRQAQHQLKGSILLALESMSSRMMRLGRNEIYFDRYITLDEVIADIEAVTADEVQNIAQDLFGREKFSTILMLPQAA